MRNLRSSWPNFDGRIRRKPCDESDTADNCPGTNRIAFRHNELSHLPALLCAARYLQRVVIEWPFELDRLGSLTIQQVTPMFEAMNASYLIPLALFFVLGILALVCPIVAVWALLQEGRRKPQPQSYSRRRESRSYLG